jgi:Na+/proline symporter
VAVVVDRVSRAASMLGLGGLASGLFAVPDPIQYRLVRLGGLGLAVLLGLAAVAVVGGRLARRALVAGSGAGFLVAAVVQLVQLGGGTNWLRGDGSTFSLFLGFGVGLLVLGLTPIPTLPDRAETTEGTHRAA